MAVYRRGEFWYYKFRFQGQSIREATHSRSKTVAIAAERTRRRELELAVNRIPRQQRMPLFKLAAKEWLSTKKTLAEKSQLGYEQRLAAVLKEFGKRLVCDIDAKAISQYQQKRLDAGQSPRTVNYEVGCVRGILKRYGIWGNVSPYVKFLRERKNVGKAISHEEEVLIIAACRKSRSPVLLSLFIVAIDTGLRASELKALRIRDLLLDWKEGRIVSGSLTVRKSKTEAGSGRSIPFTDRVCAVLTEWLKCLPDTKPDHYLFPFHTIAGSSAEPAKRMCNLDPNKPTGEWKSAWKAALRKAKLEFRWHDLRHTFISRLAENPDVSEETIRSLAGHVSREMLQRYSHIRTTARQQAIASLSQYLQNGIGTNPSK